MKRSSCPKLQNLNASKARLGDQSLPVSASSKRLLHLLAFGLLVPSTALAQVDAEVAAQSRDARDFYGCVRAFTTPVRRSDDSAPFDGVMGQVAAGLISGPSYRNAPKTFPRGMNPAGLVEGILRGVLR